MTMTSGYSEPPGAYAGRVSDRKDRTESLLDYRAARMKTAPRSVAVAPAAAAERGGTENDERQRTCGGPETG